MRSRLLRRLYGGPRSRDREAGFSLVELMIAMGVVLTGLTLLAGVMTSGLTATGYARERESATQLANQTVEQIRAFPYSVMKVGLASNDLSGDSNITGSGCGGSSCFGGEQIVSHTADPTNDKPPLVPHISNPQVTIGPTTFKVATYETYYCPGCADPTKSDARRVTVNVTWNSQLTSNTSRQVQVQTVIYSSACPPLPHPYLGPCVPSFTAIAQRFPASATISGTIDGVGLDHATIRSARATSDSNIEQVARVHGTTQASGASLQLTGQSEHSIGGQTVASNAGSDAAPGSPPIYDTHSLSAPAADSTSVSFTGGSNNDSVTVSTTGGDSGATTSTTSACTTGGCTAPASPSPRLCPNVSGFTNENDQLSCGGSTVTSAAATAQATFGNLGATTLASLTSAVNPTVATVDRKQLTSGSTCLATVANAPSDGCLHSQLSRPSGVTLSAGALPPSFAAPLLSKVLYAAFNTLNAGYFLRVSALNDSVGTDAGVGAPSPTATQSGLQITYMTQAGTLATQLLANLNVPVTLNTVTITDGTTTLTLSAAVAPASTACTSDGAPISCAAATTANRGAATATSTPPVVTVTYTLSGAVNNSLTIVLDPGVLTATTSYAAAQLT